MNLPGTSATFSHITMSAASRPYPLSPISLLLIFPTSERPHSHHRTPSRSPLCYTHSSSPPSRYMIVRLTSRPYPPSPISLLPISHFIYHSCFSTLQTSQQGHTICISFLSPFSQCSLLILVNLRTFSLALGTASHYPYVPGTSFFIRVPSPICTDIVSCLYVASRVKVRSISINPLKYSYRLFKGFV